MELTDKQKVVYDYVLANAGFHWMPNKKIFTAHITMGYDYQNYGESAEQAKDRLACFLCLQSSTYDHVIKYSK